jgi:hypothetical protein
MRRERSASITARHSRVRVSESGIPNGRTAPPIIECDFFEKIAAVRDGGAEGRERNSIGKEAKEYGAIRSSRKKACEGWGNVLFYRQCDGGEITSSIIRQFLSGSPSVKLQCPFQRVQILKSG